MITQGNYIDRNSPWISRKEIEKQNFIRNIGIVVILNLGFITFMDSYTKDQVQ